MDDSEGPPQILPSPETALPENAGESDDEDFSEAPDDTLAAVLLLKAQFPPLPGGRQVPPLVLRSQIYSIVRDRTIVDRQLDELR